MLSPVRALRAANLRTSNTLLLPQPVFLCVLSAFAGEISDSDFFPLGVSRESALPPRLPMAREIRKPASTRPAAAPKGMAVGDKRSVGQYFASLGRPLRFMTSCPSARATLSPLKCEAKAGGKSRTIGSLVLTTSFVFLFMRSMARPLADYDLSRNPARLADRKR
jgi:hypothetical protein